MHLSTEQACEILGLKFSVFRQLRRAASLPEPVFKKENAYFYDKNELIEFAKNNDVAKIISETRQKIRAGGKSIKSYNRTGNHKKKLTAKPVVTPEKRIIAETLICLFIRGKFDPEPRQTMRRISIENVRKNPPKRHIVRLSEVYGLD
jgi:hypothetical protein